ncbi:MULTISPECIES: D-alanyl-D-alanine carboxypeptidase family protein [Uliginosibacterium]|uniref:serine-type D-Ala-D-Ala carboxypeptidase n=1 Tax=Uliginosibacterium aquaticum TaxID=2731212 RepID=A0ABX2INN4_9RHOO|nr:MULTISPECIES: D-alanyl-D-alanine carboxypeptidase family protein [Uliginosibacterium]MDO6388297.1 D-alanyl-D-alanine carboxypeptidase family protein [Uliginosibacterium sp. 31-12]NSL56622.1 D-alanyl-D-alanine carboxypeptidase [Uliginosibacterium aquaticum]
MFRRLLLAASLSLPLASFAALPQPPEVAARSYAIYDMQSGQMLGGNQADMRIEPASLTKLMTAYLSFKAVKEGRLKLDQLLTPSIKAWKQEGSRMFVDIKVPVSVDDLLKGMIVQSGNDACVVLAEAIAGSEEAFVAMMNREAQRLGLVNTHYMDSNGLTAANQYTTAADLVKLSEAIIHDFPEFYPIYSIKQFFYNKIKQDNRNLLLYRDPDVDGLKTGHTASAGYNLVASSKRGGRRVISVVTGTTGMEERARESAKLLDWALLNFDTPKLFSIGQSLGTVEVFKGANQHVLAGFAADRYISLPRGKAAEIKQEITLEKRLIAPVAAGQQIGSVRLMLDGQALAEYPLTALQAVEQGSWWRRLIDSIRLWFA